MAVVSRQHTTRMILSLRDGDETAADRLMPIVSDQLRAMAGDYFRRQPAGLTLQPTALVHEAFLKLADTDRLEIRDRAHFVAVAARAMRQVLVDQARHRGRVKRGAGWERVTLDQPVPDTPFDRVDVLALDDALDRLELLEARQARVVELRFFGGMSVGEAADILGVSPRTERQLRATVTIRRSVMAEHPRLAMSLCRLGEVLVALDRVAEAEALYDEAAAIDGAGPASLESLRAALDDAIELGSEGARR